MKLTDKEAIDRFKTILKDCSPTAKKAIQDLLAIKTTTNIPAPRSIQQESLKLAEIPKTAPRVFFTDKTTAPTDNIDDNWLADWIQQKP